MSGVFKVMGQHFEKRGPATAGETVAFGKLDHAKTGDTLSAGKQAHAALAEVKPYPPVLALAVQAKERKDDVKLGAAFTKLTEEDPSITVVHNAENHEVVIWGQGEMHLRVAAERLGDRYAVPVSTRPPAVGYKRDHPQAGHRARAAQEAVRRPRPVRRRRAGDQAAAARLRLQVRGQDHRRRGAAQLHPGGGGGRARRAQARPARLPGGRYPVALIDGSYHTVDSSDMAFRIAGRIGIAEGLPQCKPVLLEPIHLVEIVCPSEATAKMNAILSGRRGQILGFDTREGWQGWDTVRAQMAEAEIGDLIIEVRSATAGVGTLHLQVRPHGRTHRPHRRPDHRGAARGGVTPL